MDDRRRCAALAGSNKATHLFRHDPCVAAVIFAGSDPAMSVYRHMQQTTRLGAKLYACSDAREAHAIDRAKLISELTGIAGAAAFVGRALDPEWTTLVF